MEVIKVENLSKRYLLGEIGTGTLSHDLNRWWAQILGKEDPNLKIILENDRTQKAGTHDSVWALKDLNFSINQGEVVGIIGRNGAGKSTLLKIISKITAPTTGTVKVKGRIASLLEVGTGFHPEMTGRENIFMNGTLLGMTTREIQGKIDEIVDFAGMEMYIDTPVKRYSSGMQVRLAFAVGAFLEPEILIVDEVLAVGDFEFQKKALGRMESISKEHGRTVLFVSHNLGAVASLCNKGILMHHGTIDYKGDVHQSLERYLRLGGDAASAIFMNQAPLQNDILQVRILNSSGAVSNTFNFNDDIQIEFTIQATEKYHNAYLGFRIKDQKDRNIFTSQVQLSKTKWKGGTAVITSIIPGSTLVPNNYSPVIMFHVPNTEVLRVIEDEISFQIEETGTDFYLYNGKDYGCVFIDCTWK
ncbi:MAG: ABC transporter ATP-binding protein [Chitinophagaceae bacterium]